MSYNSAWVPQSAAAVTPSDTTLISACAIYVGGTGNLVVETMDGNPVTFAGVPAGATVWLAIRRVKAATTATSLVSMS